MFKVFARAVVVATLFSSLSGPVTAEEEKGNIPPRKLGPVDSVSDALAFDDTGDKRFSRTWLTGLEKNYHGPAVSQAKREFEICRFTFGADGTPKWIYLGTPIFPNQSNATSQDAAEAKLESEIQKGFMDLVRSGVKPYPKPPAGWDYPYIVQIMHFSSGHPVSIWVMDFPGEVRQIVMPKTIAEFEKNSWAQAIAKKISTNFKPAATPNARVWASVFFDLYPDGTIGEIKPVTALNGRKRNEKLETAVGKQLASAVKACKKFDYTGSQMNPNEPTGVTALYRSDATPSLMVQKFIFTRDPNYVVYQKK